MVARPRTEPADDFVAMFARHRPCPQCGSLRVTVQRLLTADGDHLSATCSDCGKTSPPQPVERR